LSLSYNQLTSLPEIICNLPSNCNIKVSNNRLCEEYHYDCIDNWGTQGCTNENCESGFSSNGICYSKSDIDVLQDIIDVNESLSGEEPLEIGSQTWNDGRLEYLSLQWMGNQLTTLPESIGDLSNLTYLSLWNNQLTSLPESICNLPDDCYINVNNNQLCEEYHYDCIGSWGTQDCELSITDNLIPITYNLSSPYPNPFNPTTTISFSIPQSDLVSLNIYDITGKLVTTLINEQLNIGYHSINWDGTNQSSGMYFVRMESGEYVETQKLLLVK